MHPLPARGGTPGVARSRACATGKWASRERCRRLGARKAALSQGRKTKIHQSSSTLWRRPRQRHLQRRAAGASPETGVRSAAAARVESAEPQPGSTRRQVRPASPADGTHCRCNCPARHHQIEGHASRWRRRAKWRDWRGHGRLHTAQRARWLGQASADARNHHLASNRLTDEGGCGDGH